MRTRLRSKLSLLFIALAALIAIPAVAALGAELVTAELDGANNRVQMEQGKSADFNIDLKASGAISCEITSSNPATAKVKTSYSITKDSAANSDSTKRVLSGATYSDAKNFYSDGSSCGRDGNTPITWTGAPTGYSVPASVSVASDVPVGTYTIDLSSANSTTQTTNPSVSKGGKLNDTTATTLTFDVVAPPPPADSTAPVITPSIQGTLGDNGWYTSDVLLSWTVVDNESAISSQSGCDDVKIISDQNATTYKCTATSSGGTSSEQVSIKRDATAPTVTVSPDRDPNANGWYNSAVTFSTDGTDATSDIASCDSPQSYNGPDGTNLTVNGSCKDNAGNSAQGTSKAFSYDATKPTLKPSVSPNPVLLNGIATASPGADDNLSGVDTSSCDPVDTSSVGSKSVACTATDKAGNSNSANASYSVAYKFVGFSQPVDNNVPNSAKAGQAIPLKWQLLDANNVPVTNLSSAKVTVESLSCSLGTTPDAIEEYASGSSGLQNLGGGYYQFNWKTPTTYAKSCKTMKLDIGDGTPHNAQFQFTK